MIHLNHFFPLHLFLVFLLPSIPSIQSSSPCNHRCGPSVVPYPFGFSDTCGIPLKCNLGTPHIGNFPVNISLDSILVNLPAQCNRSIDDLAPLFTRNYAPSHRNALLLQNCTVPPNGCVMPRGLLEPQFRLGECEEPVCYSEGNNSLINGVMKYADVKNSTCKLVYSSVVVNGDNTTSLVFLDFQTVELAWWLDGKCDCDRNGKCFEMKGVTGFRCKCGEGFKGDGFLAGNGCSKGRNKADIIIGTILAPIIFAAMLVGAVVGVALLISLGLHLISFLRTLLPKIRRNFNIVWWLNYTGVTSV